MTAPPDPTHTPDAADSSPPKAELPPDPPSIATLGGSASADPLAAVEADIAAVLGQREALHATKRRVLDELDRRDAELARRLDTLRMVRRDIDIQAMEARNALRRASRRGLIPN